MIPFSKFGVFVLQMGLKSRAEIGAEVLLKVAQDLDKTSGKTGQEDVKKVWHLLELLQQYPSKLREKFNGKFAHFEIWISFIFAIIRC